MISRLEQKAFSSIRRGCLFSLTKSNNRFIPDKPFRNYDQQILLLKSRGLIIKNENLAKHQLKTYSYYDLINGNLDKLMASRHPDHFNDGVTMNNLVQIRIIEDRIKSVFLQQILMIERTFKSTLSYYISEHYGVDSNPGGYLSKSNYSSTRSRIVTRTMKALRNICDGNVGNKIQGAPIKYYRKNHNHIPPWILVDELTLGETIYWFKGINGSGKKSISAEMLHLPSSLSTAQQLEVFQTTIDIIREFRNLFAHNSVLSHMSSRRELNILLLGDPTTNANLVSDLENNAANSHNLAACFLSILVLSNDYDQLGIFLAEFEQTISVLDGDSQKFIIEDIFHFPLFLITNGKVFAEKLVLT